MIDDAWNAFQSVYICKLFHAYGRLEKLDIRRFTVDSELWYGMVYDALREVFNFAAFGGDEVDTTIYFSDPIMLEYYRLCRDYCQMYGVSLKNNPFMANAEKYVNCMMNDNISGGGYGWTLHTRINHENASGILFAYCDYYFGHSALLELLEVMLEICEYYKRGRLNPVSGMVKVESRDNGVVSHKEITVEALTECLRGSIKAPSYASGLLPEGCISFFAAADGSRVISILHPERYADIAYHKTVYPRFPLPRLVFRFSLHQGLRVNEVSVAVVEEGRLKPESQLFRWPFSNVSGFHMCIGNNVMPKCESLHTLSSLPYLILELPNNDDYFQTSDNRLGMGYRELLEHLQDREPSYYYEKVLVPGKYTLADFIRQKQ